MNPTGVGGFSKGHSGNPGGRRKKTAEDIEIQQLARQHGATAIDAEWAIQSRRANKGSY
jgi:hypothetical protein